MSNLDFWREPELASNIKLPKNLGFLIVLFFISGLSSNAQTHQHAIEAEHILKAKPFNGHFYTPPAQWIQNKMSTPSQSLIGDPPCSSISVSYSGFSAEAQAAFQAAVDIWETVLSTNVTISIDATWTVLEGNVLGSASSYKTSGFSNAPNSYQYPLSLANQIAGFDIQPSNPDMILLFNSSYSWYLGTDGQTPFNQHDFISVVLHEIGHGLGISCSSGYNETTLSGTFNSPYYFYDTWLTNGFWGEQLIETPNGVGLGNEFTSNDIFWDGPFAVSQYDGNPVPIYAPPSWEQGSSMSHVDEATFPAGDPNSLMSPGIGAGEAIHNPGEIVIGMLKDLGWEICYADDYCVDVGGYIGEGCDDEDSTTLFEVISDNCQCTGESGFTSYSCGDFGGNIYCYGNNENTTWKYYSESEVPLNLNFSQGTIEGGYDNLTIYDGTSTAAPVLYTTNFQTDDGIVDISDISVTSTTGFLTMHLETDFGESCQFGTSDIQEMIWELSCIPTCENTAAFGTVNLNGTNEVNSISGCSYENEYSTINGVQAGNQYTFTSGNGGYITIRAGSPSGPALNAGYSPLSATAITDETLYAHWTVDENCTTNDNCVTTTVQCTTCDLDCPLFLGNVGEPCDDGNILTTGDIITEDCTCEGINEGCVNTNPYAFVNLDGSSETQVIEYCNYENEYSEIFNVEADATYRFTSSGEFGYITIRSGSFNGPVVGAGFSPLIITTASNDDLFAHWNYDAFCNTAQYCITTTVQCVSCGIDCPIFLENVGDPCDDQDPNTYNDVITESCECEGESIFPTPSNDNPCNAINLFCGESFLQSTYYATQSGLTSLTCTSGSEQDVFYKFYPNYNGEFNEYHIQIDGANDFNAVLAVYEQNLNCNDLIEIACVNASGVDGIEEISFINYNTYSGYYYFRVYDLDDDYGEFQISLTCSVYYECEELQGNIGGVCDDGNPQTVNEIINEDCECVGIPIPENDSCENAEELNVWSEGGCPTNETAGTTNGASGPSLNPPCSGGEDYNTDVFYWFDSQDYTHVYIDFNVFTVTPYSFYIELLDECDGTSNFCINGSGLYEVDVEQNTSYIVRITNSGSYNGPFTICLTGATECPGFENQFVGDPCDDGNSATLDDTLNEDCECVGLASTASLVGNFEWNNNCAPRNMSVEFYEPGTSNLIETLLSTLSSEGSFELSNLPLGTYDIYLTIEGCLTDGFLNFSVVAGSNQITGGVPRRGDINGDNGVNIIDISFINVAFGSAAGGDNFNPLADMNCDNGVNIIDFSIVNSSFGLTGDQPE